MKLHVITNEKGEVIGTSKVQHQTAPGAPQIGKFTPADGQSVHEIEMSKELLEIKDPGELHKALSRHIKQSYK